MLVGFPIARTAEDRCLTWVAGGGQTYGGIKYQNRVRARDGREFRVMSHHCFLPF